MSGEGGTVREMHPEPTVNVCPCWRLSQTWATSCCRVKCSRVRSSNFVRSSITWQLQRKEGGSGQSQSATPGVGWRGRWLAVSCLHAMQLCLWLRGAARFWKSRVAPKLPSTRVDILRYVENMPQGHVFVKIDFTNAFNTLRRDVILRGCRTITCPSYFRTRRFRTAGTAICSSATFSLPVAGVGRSRVTRSDQLYSFAWPSTICCHRCSRRLSSDTWTTCRWGARQAGWRRTSLCWSRAQRSSASHTTDPSVSCRAYRYDSLDSGCSRGDVERSSSGGLGSLRISSTSRQRGRHRAGIQAGGSGDTGQPTASHAG